MYIENPKNENYLNNENILFKTINANFKQILRDNFPTIQKEMENIPINEIIFYVILRDIRHLCDLNMDMYAVTECKIIEEKFYKYPELKQIFCNLIEFIAECNVNPKAVHADQKIKNAWREFSYNDSYNRLNELTEKKYRRKIQNFNVFKNSLLSVLKESKDIYLSTEDSEKIIKIFHEHLSYFECESDKNFQHFTNITVNRITFTYQAFHLFYIMQFNPAKVSLYKHFCYSNTAHIFKLIKFLTQDLVKLKEFINLKGKVEYKKCVFLDTPNLVIHSNNTVFCLNDKVFYDYRIQILNDENVDEFLSFHFNALHFYLRIVYLQWEKDGQTQNISTKTNQSTNKQNKIERLMEIMQLQ